MKPSVRPIRIAVLSAAACVPTAIALYCAAAFDLHSEESMILLPLVFVAYLAQIIITVMIGALSPSFRSAFAISAPSCLIFGAALIFFCVRSGLFVIRRLPSGYLFGIHPNDDAQTWSVLIDLFILILVTAAMLIIKGVNARRREGKNVMSLRSLSAIITALIPISSIVWADVLYFIADEQRVCLYFALASVPLMPAALIAVGFLAKEERTALIISFGAVAVYFIAVFTLFRWRLPIILPLSLAASIFALEIFSVRLLRRYCRKKRSVNPGGKYRSHFK